MTALHQRGRGILEIGLALREGRTALRHLHQVSPLRALFPTPERDEALTVAMVNTGGGLAGGDALATAVTAVAGCRATLTTPAAEKIYRSLGPSSCIGCTLTLGPDAQLEWIPQETILFDGARLQRRIEADLAPGAALLAAEMLVFGRAARGETFAAGALQDGWRIRREGRLLWADGLALRDPAALRNAFGFGGAEAMATLLFVGEAAPSLLPLLRDAGTLATLPQPGLLLARWLGGAAEARGLLGEAIGCLRNAAFGLPTRLPRLWTS